MANDYQPVADPRRFRTAMSIGDDSPSIGGQPVINYFVPEDCPVCGAPQSTCKGEPSDAWKTAVLAEARAAAEQAKQPETRTGGWRVLRSNDESSTGTDTSGDQGGTTGALRASIRDQTDSLTDLFGDDFG